jgi:hypothetical protein
MAVFWNLFFDTCRKAFVFCPINPRNLAQHSPDRNIITNTTLFDKYKRFAGVFEFERIWKQRNNSLEKTKYNHPETPDSAIDRIDHRT